MHKTSVTDVKTATVQEGGAWQGMVGSASAVQQRGVSPLAKRTGEADVLARAPSSAAFPGQRASALSKSDFTPPCAQLVATWHCIDARSHAHTALC